MVTKGAAGYWLLSLLIENFDNENLGSRVLGFFSFLAFGGNPSAFLLLASPMITNCKKEIIKGELSKCDFTKSIFIYDWEN